MRSLILCLCLLLLSTTAFAQVKHIVFNIDGTLIQGIPAKNYGAFTNKDQMIAVTADGRSSYYYIFPHTSALLNSLQKKDQYVLHFMTSNSMDWATAVLGAINLPAPIGAPVMSYLKDNSVSQLFTKSDLTNGKLDLKKITSDLSNVIVITSVPHVVLDEQSENEFFLGKNLFFFETFAMAQAEKASAASALQENFPSTEEEWLLEQNKMPYISQALRNIKAQSSSNLVSDLKNLNPDKKALTQQGILMARYKFEEKVLLFKYNPDRTQVTGCGTYHAPTDRYLDDKPLEQCLKIFSTKFKFRFDQKNYKVSACEMRDEATGALIKTVELRECRESSKSDVSYHWQGEKRISCGAYVKEYFLDSADNSKCSESHMILEQGTPVIRYYFEVDGELVSVIPEIASLKASSTLSSALYSRYDSKILSLSLVQWMRLQRGETKEIQDKNFDFMNDTRILMAFNFTYLNSIISKGFLNQHETKTSGGCNCQSKRADAEDRFANVRLESIYGTVGEKVHKLRPKYSFLILDKFRKDMGLTKVYRQYGNVHAVFKQDTKLRSTFTPGDSLNISAVATDVKTFWYQSQNILSMNPKRDALYWEAQIWGQLLVEDVDYFLVNCMETLSAAQIEVVKGTGRPVYSCNLSWGEDKNYPYNLTKKDRL